MIVIYLDEESELTVEQIELLKTGVNLEEEK